MPAKLPKFKTQEAKIISLVLKKPLWSSHKLAKYIILSNNSIYKVLKRYNLNNRKKRLLFAKKYKNLPVKQVLAKLQSFKKQKIEFSDTIKKSANPLFIKAFKEGKIIKWNL